MMKSMIIAFSTYSKIPMPIVEWEEDSMKYSMCFFPLVGAVVGFCCLCLYGGLHFIGVGQILTAAILTALPLLLTGGIHMDGFLDTMDAKSSYKPREEKLKILKDPHTGAFAVMHCALYLLLSFGLFSEISGKTIPFAALGYVYSRILSGLSVVTLKKAKGDGMAAVSANAAAKNVKWILVLELFACAAGFLVLDILRGGFCILAGLLCLLYYRNMAYRIFGGITGDLAGYFLQICELAVLAVAAVADYVITLSI